MNGWLIEQANRITFVMVDSNYSELTGLTLSIEVSKDGGAFSAAAGSWGEISNGWYWYLSTAAEADTVGPVSVRITAAGAIQQNLEYTVVQRTSGFVWWPYQVTYLAAPIDGVRVWVTSDILGDLDPIWTGYTNVTGWAKDEAGNDPLLPAGVPAYFWKWKANYRDLDNPDTENPT